MRSLRRAYSDGSGLDRIMCDKEGDRHLGGNGQLQMTVTLPHVLNWKSILIPWNLSQGMGKKEEIAVDNWHYSCNFLLADSIS